MILLFSPYALTPAAPGALAGPKLCSLDALEKSVCTVNVNIRPVNRLNQLIAQLSVINRNQLNVLILAVNSGIL